MKTEIGFTMPAPFLSASIPSAGSQFKLHTHPHTVPKSPLNKTGRWKMLPVTGAKKHKCPGGAVKQGHSPHQNQHSYTHAAKKVQLSTTDSCPLPNYAAKMLKNTPQRVLWIDNKMEQTAGANEVQSKMRSMGGVHCLWNQHWKCKSFNSDLTA